MDRLRDLSTKAITERLRKITRIFGIPLSCRTDGGPQFRGPFDEWCRQQGIKHETTSPYNPRSNGHVEAAVKAAKHLILKTTPAEFEEALAAWRNTARKDSPSPNEMLFGRRVRDYKAMTLSALKGEEPAATQVQHIPEDQLRKHVFIQGDHVHIQDQKTKRWNMHAVVTGISSTGRTLDMLTTEGHYITRNRMFVKKICAPQRDS